MIAAGTGRVVTMAEQARAAAELLLHFPDTASCPPGSKPGPHPHATQPPTDPSREEPHHDHDPYRHDRCTRDAELPLGGEAHRGTDTGDPPRGFGAFEKAEAAYTEVEHLRAVLTARIADLRRRNA